MTATSTGALRIAVVSDAAPGRNGVGAYYQDLIHHLADHVERVSLFSPVIENGQWKAGLVLPMPGDKTQKACVPNPARLKRWLAHEQPHVVIVPTPGPYGLIGATLARRQKTPVVTGFHTAFEQLADLYWPGRIMGRLARGYFEHTNRFLFRRSRGVLAHSDSMVAMARRLGADEPLLVGTPIPPDFIQPAIQPCTGELKRCLFAGRLAAEKNVESVIDAARAHPDLAFTIAGTGPLRSVVDKAAHDVTNLTYVGWLSRAALREQVDAHDILLLPSHFESFGTVALEAMARERLALVSDGCGISQWPGLADHLAVFRGEDGPGDSLGLLKEESSESRIVQAQGAYRAALALHTRCLEDWLQLLAGHAGSAGAP